MLSLPPEARQKLRARLMDEEGFRSKVYTDSRGNLTIGIGRSVSTNGITMDEALYLLDNDISRCEKELWHYCPWYADIDDARKTVLADMVFELGIHGLLEFREMITYLTSKCYEQAAKAMLASKWAQEVPRRASRLALIMETGAL